jgi:hypothetical protein
MRRFMCGDSRGGRVLAFNLWMQVLPPELLTKVAWKKESSWSATGMGQFVDLGI